MSSGRDVMMENWDTESQSDPCEYADTAIEQLLVQNMKLREENKELREQIKRLLWSIQEHD